MRVAIYAPKEVPEAQALEALAAELARLRPTLVGYGSGRRGVDLAALEWCARELCAAIGMSPDERRGGVQGRVRDEHMAAWCEALVVLWDPCSADPQTSERGGPTMEAIKRGRRVVFVVLSPDWRVVDCYDTHAGATADQITEILRRERVPRPRRSRAKAA